MLIDDQGHPVIAHAAVVEPIKPKDPPIQKKLEDAPAPEASKIVDNLTEPQKKDLQTGYAKLDAGQKQDYANKLAGTLDGAHLYKLHQVLEPDGNVFATAAARTPNTQQDFHQAEVGLSDATVLRLGLTSQELKDFTKPVADKLNAIAKSIGDQDYDAAAQQILDLKKDAAPLARQVLTGLIDKSNAPQSVKDFVDKNPDLVERAIELAPATLTHLAKGEFGAAIAGLAGDDTLRGEVVAALAKNPKVAAVLKQLGDIAQDKLKDAPPAVIDAITKAADGKWKDAVLDLAKAAADGNAIAKSAFSKAMQRIDNLPQPIKDILDNPKLQDALRGAGQKALQSLLDGKPIDALKELKDPALLDAVADAVLAQPDVKAKLDKFGVSADSVKKAGDAIPDLLHAMDKLDSDPAGALRDLAGAVGKAPELVADLAAKAGEKLKGDSAATQLLKSLVTDKQLMTTLLGNSDAHDAVKQIFQGNVTQGLKALGNNDEANAAIAKHITTATDPATTALRARLDKLGFKSEEDIAKIGPVLGDVIELGENLAKGKDMDLAAALQTLGEIGRGLPEDTRSQVLDKLLGPLTEHLPKLSPEIKEVIKQVAIGVTDPAVLKTFTDGIKALPGDPGKFLGNMLSTVKSLSGNHEVQKAVLNALGKIGGGKPQDKGNIGAFFADPDFNAELVDSGAIDSFLEGVESIMKGDMLEGLKKLGGIMGALLTDGNELKIGGQFIGKKVFGHEVGFHLPSIGLKIGDKGLENMKNLMERVFDALPKGARDKIEKSITDAAARVVGGTFPGLGDIKNIISDGKDLITEWGSNDTVDNVLNVAKLLSSIGGVIPGPIGTASDSLGAIVGTIEGIKGAVDTVRSGLDLTSALGVT